MISKLETTSRVFSRKVVKAIVMYLMLKKAQHRFSHMVTHPMKEMTYNRHLKLDVLAVEKVVTMFRSARQIGQTKSTSNLRM